MLLLLIRGLTKNFAYLLIYSLRVQPGTELYDDEVRRIVVSVVFVVVAQRVVDLESQLAPGSIERGDAHVAKEHLHCDLQARMDNGRETTTTATVHCSALIG